MQDAEKKQSGRIKMKLKKIDLWVELRHHLPFSILSVCFGLMAVGVLNFLSYLAGSGDISFSSSMLFHVFHPVHLLFSAIATTAMFWQHEKKFFKAVVIGFFGSAGICGISDIFIPYVSGLLLGAHMHLHVCIIEHPVLILPFIILGIIGGFLAPGALEKQEGVILSHSLHVFVSSMASILYLIGYGLTNWFSQIGAVLIYMVIAVVLPCCTSDIIFPLLLVGNTHKR